MKEVVDKAMTDEIFISQLAQLLLDRGIEPKDIPKALKLIAEKIHPTAIRSDLIHPKNRSKQALTQV
jgi:hypothetical protein